MRPWSHSRRVSTWLACGALVVYGTGFVRERADAASATATARTGLVFAPDVSPADRATVLAAVGHARPSARRLIEEVSGRVTVKIAVTGGDTVGLTEGTPDAWTVTLDLDRVEQHYGSRGVDRVVLHEFGHVVDFTLTPPELDRTMDGGIPRGWGCDDGRSGACAAPAERFAETFAKWATDDIGIDLSVGYKVPPPSAGLDTWGVPLDGMARHAERGSILHD